MGAYFSDRSRYQRTDMAAESYTDAQLEQGVRGIRYREYQLNGIPVSRLHVTDGEGAAVLGKPEGRYVTLQVGRVWLLEDEALDQATAALAAELAALLRTRVPEPHTVLVVGLGNRFITSDAVGPLAVKHLTVTRHLARWDPALFQSLQTLSLAAVAPGVVGQTGIETADLIRGTVERVKPDAVICIDALAAKNVERLAVTVQLSDNGIAPGSGIGNHRQALDEALLGCPVLTMGVPTVVDSSTMVYGVLEQAGITEPDGALRQVLENGKRFFVTLKETDTATAEMASLMARAIEQALSLRPSYPEAPPHTL